MFNLNISCFENGANTDQLPESQLIDVLRDQDLNTFPLILDCKHMKEIYSEKQLKDIKISSISNIQYNKN